MTRMVVEFGGIFWYVVFFAYISSPERVMWNVCKELAMSLIKMFVFKSDEG